MKKAIVITSIFPPTESIKRFAQLKGWKVIVVGDKKTPKDWTWKNVRYISQKEQETSDFKIAQALPWNHYARKMIGYLYASKSGVDIIVDTDDDNIPKDDWHFPSFINSYDLTPPERNFINVYIYFSDQHIWPRGFPLNRILKDEAVLNDWEVTKQVVKVGIWQGLADGDPDVDAVYRLTSNASCYFKEKEPIVLNKGTVSPFNSQNTAFIKDVFPLLYLPAFVSFRFTDILRGLVAQPIMWQAGYFLGFTKATVIQKRNEHNYLQDFESEIPCYLHAEKIIEIVKDAINADCSITDNLFYAYENLYKHEIVRNEELNLLSAWIADTQNLL